MSYLSEGGCAGGAGGAEDAQEGRTQSDGRHRGGRYAGPRRIQPDRVWLVLARREYEEPLRQIGTVEADDSDLARVYARSIYDEFAWIEMAVVPRDAIVTVIAS